MDRRLRSGIFVAALVTGLATAPAATAAPAPATGGMPAAVRRDLGPTAPRAAARLAAEKHASDLNQVLRKDLRGSYGGGWLDGGELVVGVTPAPAAAGVRARGATARVVAHSETALDAARVPRTVPGWYVDVAANRVAVLSRPSATDAAWRFVRGAGRQTRCGW